MKQILLSLSAIFFISCGGGGGSGGSDTSEPQTCSIETENRYLYEYMRSWYLWNDQMPEINDFSAYASPNDLLNVLRVDQDKWSYVISEEEFENEYNDNNNNFGVRYRILDDSLSVLYTFPNSPMRKAGIQRGAKISAINNKSVKSLIDSNTLNAIFENATLSFTYTKPDSDTAQNVEVQKASYTSSPVLYSNYYTKGDLVAGYVVLESFDYQTTERMAEVFASFKAHDVNKIIIDLRYNGGGLINIINYLGYMLDSDVGGKESFSLNYNDEHQASNSTQYFLSNTAFNPFNFDEVVFITSKDTASASEALINALVPYTKVYLIGGTTHGKPVGMNVISNCGLSYMPIVFRIENAKGDSTSFDGIGANCNVTDTEEYSFGDTRESLLNASLNYIATGTCTSTASSRALAPKGEIRSDALRHKAMFLDK